VQILAVSPRLFGKPLNHRYRAFAAKQPKSGSCLSLFWVARAISPRLERTLFSSAGWRMLQNSVQNVELPSSSVERRASFKQTLFPGLKENLPAQDKPLKRGIRKTQDKTSGEITLRPS
jgi:hypothetical protein